MNKIYHIWILTCFLFLASCYEEDTIVPSPPGNSGRFEFPQGNNSWDNDILAIYEEYGVRLIYKDIIEKDFTKNWTGGGGVSAAIYGTGCVNDEMTQFYVQFMKEHVFQYLNPQITEKVFPMYWYLTYDFYSITSFGSISIPTAQINQATFNFLDAWLTCFWGTEHPAPPYGGILNPTSEWKSPVRENKGSYSLRRFEIINTILLGAMSRGNITIPEGFDDRFDHITKLVTSDTDASKANPEYYLTRGYPGSVNTTTLNYSKPSSTTPTDATVTFRNYVALSLRFTPAEREDRFPSALYPFVREKFDYVQRYMKEQYNIDLEAIANGPDNWEITPYPELPVSTPAK